MTLSFGMRREHHAITEFMAAVEFFQPISQSGFGKVVERLRIVAAELKLPAPMPIQTFQFMAGPAGMQSGSPALPGGVGFQRFSEAGEIAMSILCDANSITVTLRDYDNWESVYPRIRSAIEQLVIAYSVEIPAISSVRLQYLNEFRALSSETQSASELFNSNTIWLAPVCFGPEAEWHCHSGRYLAPAGAMRQLVNVNANSSRSAIEFGEEPRIYVALTLVGGCYYNLPGMSPLIVNSASAQSTLDRHFNLSHDLEKSVLRDVLSGGYLRAIGEPVVH